MPALNKYVGESLIKRKINIPKPPPPLDDEMLKTFNSQTSKIADMIMAPVINGDTTTLRSGENGAT